MFSYVVLLLLINAYSSLSLPVKNSTDSIAASLESLASQCANKFIAKTILEKINHCNESMKLKSKEEIMCLMFYDINIQLCAGTINADLNDDTIRNKISEAQVRKSLCDTAQTWTFGNLQNYPEYRQSVSTIFKSQDKCISACAVIDDILSDDSSYYCKYFKWGMDILQEQKVIKTLDQNVIQNDSKQNNSITSTTTNDVPKVEQKEINSDLKTINSNTTLESSTVSKGEVSQKSTYIPTKDKQLEKIPIKTETEEKDDARGIENPLSQNKETNNVNVEPMIGEGEDQEDDNERDEEGIPDTNDKNETDEEDFNSEPKKQMDKTNSHELRIKSSNVEYSQKEVNPQSPDRFTEEDDNFFPFFMTTIILVVVLYVLYHNKSKFTKVILGLLVEGRQTGRRRNSRGHAYRRLDTLEQAMSSDTTAPPSKIIY